MARRLVHSVACLSTSSARRDTHWPVAVAPEERAKNLPETPAVVVIKYGVYEAVDGRV